MSKNKTRLTKKHPKTWRTRNNIKPNWPETTLNLTDQNTQQFFQQFGNYPFIFMNSPGSLLRVFLVFCQFVKNPYELLTIMWLKQSIFIFTARLLRYTKWMGIIKENPLSHSSLITTDSLVTHLLICEILYYLCHGLWSSWHRLLQVRYDCIDCNIGLVVTQTCAVNISKKYLRYSDLCKRNLSIIANDILIVLLLLIHVVSFFFQIVIYNKLLIYNTGGHK